MAMDPYSPCSCGSGNKFKWCCMSIWGGIEKAFAQYENGQHDAALLTMKDVVTANPNKPEARGRYAMMLFEMQRFDEAESVLDEALQIDPQYAFGHYLRGQFRMGEGEFAGALLMFRKAAKMFSPEARQQLAAIHARIAETEMRLNRPVAARAGLQIALRIDPSISEFRQTLEALFGEESKLPRSARKDYEYLHLPSGVSAQNKKIWQKAQSQLTTGQLEDARTAFAQITKADPENAAAWYNFAVTCAWLGDNGAALRALEEYVQREPDADQIESAWALAEVLRCGAGLEDSEADFAAHSFTYQIQDGSKFADVLRRLEEENRLALAQLHEDEQVFTAIFVRAPTVLVADAASAESPRFAAHFLLLQGLLRIWSLTGSEATNVAAEIEQLFGSALSKPQKDIGPAPFDDLLSEALVFPIVDEQTPQDELKSKVVAGAAEFFEQTWIHRPLKSLSGLPPIDAAGHDLYRKKLFGIIRFLKECADSGQFPFQFDGVCRKLGLLEPPAEATGIAHISAMSAAELSSLNAGELTHEELDKAQQAALRLDARDVAAVFLKRIVERPAVDGPPDRFPWFNQLIKHELASSNVDEAMQYVDAGEKTDCENNEGRRRNDYELWRGRVHARRGEVASAQDVFDRLIARDPDRLAIHGAAAEAMLSAKDKDRALRFAKAGLDKSRKQQDRDSEQYFLELSAAAGGQ